MSFYRKSTKTSESVEIKILFRSLIPHPHLLLALLTILAGICIGRTSFNWLITNSASPSVRTNAFEFLCCWTFIFLKQRCQWINKGQLVIICTCTSILARLKLEGKQFCRIPTNALFLQKFTIVVPMKNKSAYVCSFPCRTHIWTPFGTCNAIFTRNIVIMSPTYKNHIYSQPKNPNKMNWTYIFKPILVR
jgi:hypothetical protein